MRKATFYVLALSVSLSLCFSVYAADFPAARSANIDFDQSIDASAFLKKARENAARDPLPEPAAADQNVFDYKVGNYPKDGGTCPEVASRLGEKFERVTGANVIRGLCENADDDGYDIRISYRAPGRLKLVSTARFGSSIDSAAAYADLEQCRAAIPDEEARFRRATGLEPVVVYCSTEKLWIKDPWVLQIDAFGETAVAPRLSNTTLFGSISGLTTGQFLAGVREGIERQGVEVSFVKLRPSIGYAHLSTLYYGEAWIPLFFREFAEISNREQCDEQLGLARQALGAAPETVYSYCSYNRGGAHYSVSFLFAGGKVPDSTVAYERYDSYASCMVGRPGMVKYYRDDMGQEVAGALCGKRDGVWRVILLESAG